MIAYINNSVIAGIAIDTIRKIDKIYNNKKQSLLQTIVLSFLRSCSKRLAFVDRYPNMSRLVRIDIKDMDRSRLDLSNALKSVETDVEAIAAQAGSDGSVETFVAHMQQFIAGGKEKVDEMNAEHEKMVNHTNRCLQFFGATQIEGFVAAFVYMLDSIKRYMQLEVQKEAVKLQLSPLTPQLSNASTRGQPAAGKKPVQPSSSQQPLRAVLVPVRQPAAGKENAEPPKKRPQLVRKKVEVDQKYKKKDKESEAIELASSSLSIRERETVNKSRP